MTKMVEMMRLMITMLLKVEMMNMNMVMIVMRIRR